MRGIVFSSSPSSPLPTSAQRALFFFYHSVVGERQQQHTARKAINECGENGGRDVRVEVWWDFENCAVPAGVSVCRVAHRITAALRTSGICGPVNITAFGDISQLSRPLQEALSATGVGLSHVPRRGKNSADKNLLVDLVYWVSQNPPPAHLFLISGDVDFSNVLHRLRMRNYNILLACREPISPMLYSVATIMWPWNALVRGHTLLGKHFNHPPDGESSSWYGHFKGLLEDPFVDVKQPQTDPLYAEGSEEPPVEANFRPVPKSTIERIYRIVNSCPDGIRIDELRAELLRQHIMKPKDYFGHVKFSLFLLSVPCLRMRSDPLNEGKLIVYYRHPKPVEPVKLKSASSSEEFTEKGRLNSSPPENLKSVSVSLVSDGESKELKKDKDETKDLSDRESADDNEKEAKESLLQRIERFFFGQQTIDSGPKSALQTNDACHRDSMDQSSSCPSDSINLTPGSNKSDPVVKSFQTSVVGLNPVSKLLKLMFGIESFPMFNKTSSAITDNATRIEGAESSAGINPSTHDFALGHNFWCDMKSFLCSAEGVALISKAKSRGDIVKELRKDRPSILVGLSDSSLHQLVETLISEKKWIEESDSGPFPFKLPCSENSSPSSLTNHVSKGLSSIFSNGMLLSEASSPEVHSYPKIIDNITMKPKDLAALRAWLQSIPENYKGIDVTGLKRHFEGQFHCKFDPRVYGFDTAKELLEACCSNIPNSTGKAHLLSRDKIVGHCQDMVDELISQHPQGFNLGMLKDSFRRKYGYHLDHQTLGYLKLSALIQVMRGVRVDGVRVFPKQEIANKCGRQEAVGLSVDGSYEAIKLDSGGSDSAGSDDEVVQDSVFEELGPITESDGSVPLCERNGEEKNLELSAESPYLLEDLANSDSISPTENDERESETSANPVKQDTLLQILNRWNEVQDRSKKEHQGLDGSVYCSRVCGPTSGGVNHNEAMNQRQKPKQSKNYSFVEDTAGDEKHDLIDGLFRTVKKSPNQNSETQGRQQHVG